MRTPTVPFIPLLSGVLVILDWRFVTGESVRTANSQDDLTIRSVVNFRGTIRVSIPSRLRQQSGSVHGSGLACRFDRRLGQRFSKTACNLEFDFGAIYNDNLRASYRDSRDRVREETTRSDWAEYVSLSFPIPFYSQPVRSTQLPQFLNRRVICEYTQYMTPEFTILVYN